MIHSVWLNAWDFAGRHPGAVLDELRDLGLTACNLGLSYHGGRMLLPRHPHSAVYEQHPGALYFPAAPERFSYLTPVVAPEAVGVESFLAECSAQNFPVYAWTVLCHNDGLPLAAQKECCIQNAFGDRYSYALCPANPHVAAYGNELCRQIAQLPAVAAIDLEAMSFLGYPHQSLHDKRGAPLGAEAEWLLSICFCPHCCAGLGRDAADLRNAVRQRLRHLLQNGVASDFHLDGTAERILEWRKTALLRLLQQLPQQHIILRLANDYRFNGGKTQLVFEDVPPAVKGVTLTFFGASEGSIKQGLRNLPHDRAVFAGTSILHPDIPCNAALSRVVNTLRAFPLAGVAFYHYGLANNTQLNWLRQALRS